VSAHNHFHDHIVQQAALGFRYIQEEVVNADHVPQPHRLIGL
jgi:hypothetical protein